MLPKNADYWAPNPITQDAVFQCLSDTPLSKSSALCVKLISSVWRICAPVGIVVQTHTGFYDALGSQKCFLPLSYLLNQSPPHVLLFWFVFAPKQLSLTFSSGTALRLQQWHANAQKVSPSLMRIANLLLATFLQGDKSLQLYSPIKVFFSHLLFCEAWFTDTFLILQLSMPYATQNVNNCIISCWLFYFICLRYSSKIV